ncbi:MAG: hypothetical protein CM15mP4_0480 [Candidatus Neomarinimicrobiota bacterium]|nr:MAG: hypothetical protein CM15mP4_0480 [Candidatus Neomarinimicrobiota bacterium]
MGNIFLQETGQGMATDINGYYIIQDIVPGIIQLWFHTSVMTCSRSKSLFHLMSQKNRLALLSK